MKFDKIPNILTEIPGFTALNEFDQLSVTEVAMSVAQAEYTRLLSGEAVVSGTQIVRIYYHALNYHGESCAVIGFEDLTEIPNSPASIYASAWKNNRLTALSATNTKSWRDALNDLEYRIVKNSERAGDYIFPLDAFISCANWDEHATTLIMPPINLEEFTTSDEARDYIYREQAKQLLDWKGDIRLLTKANGNCDNVMGRVARHLGKVLAESSMFEQQAISVAKHEATQACQKLYAKTGKLASSWGAW